MKALKSYIEKQAKLFKELSEGSVLLLHHNDTDGLSSASILLQAFEKLALKTRSFCLEKPYPVVLEKIFNEHILEQDIIVFADFGSGMLSEIAALNNKGAGVFVIDHHNIDQKPDNIHLVNCLECGIKGSSACSASALCYLFACALDQRNKSLANLGILGALGDRHFNANGKLSGVNHEVYKEAAEQKLAFFNDEYEVLLGEKFKGADLCHALDALGSFAYLTGGIERALHGLKAGFDKKLLSLAQDFRDGYQKALKGYLASLELNKSPQIDSFVLDERFANMGVKTVGLVCEYLCDHDLVSQDKYIAGFQMIPDKIPGLGTFSFNQYKVSMRLGKSLKPLVFNGEKTPLNELLPKATKALDGFVDACHMHAAASVISIGDEEKLLELMQGYLTN